MMEDLISTLSFQLREEVEIPVEEDETMNQSSHVLVTPGQVICNETGYLRGHGTYIKNNQLIASVSGVVEKVNQLISVRSLKSRYIGAVGDLVVGRITEVGNKRWKVDVNGYQDAGLLLCSVNLPTGAQRRRTAEDQLNMRSFFVESDLISAEIQEVRYDGSIWLHTRSLRYGKLENGQFIRVEPGLIKRMKQHMVSLSCGVDLILGNNGYIWITISMENEQDEDDNEEEEDFASTSAEILLKRKKQYAERILTKYERQKIACIYNIIQRLQKQNHIISPEIIMKAFEHYSNK